MRAPRRADLSRVIPSLNVLYGRAVGGISRAEPLASWQEESSTSKIWSAAFALVAVLFNPIFPVYLRRPTWYYIDIAVAMMLAAHLAIVRLRWLQTSKPSEK